MLCVQVIDDTLYVMHGKPEKNEDNAAISALDLNSYEWKSLHPEGIPPPYPATGMSSWVYNERLYIFGGEHKGGISQENRQRYPSWIQFQHRPFNDSNQLFFYDVSTNRWVWPTSVSGDIPSPRSLAKVAIQIIPKNIHKNLQELYRTGAIPSFMSFKDTDSVGIKAGTIIENTSMNKLDRRQIVILLSYQRFT